MTREEPDPLAAPLTYPGLSPTRAAVLVTDTDILDIRPLWNAELGKWPVRNGTPLDQILLEEGAPPVAERIPVLAVGSNASPAQVRRKTANAGMRPTVPITAVKACGLTVGVSAHVSKPGYVPATPIHNPAAVSDMWVLWLDSPLLTVMDATEPNYHRVRLPARYPVHLESGRAVRDCWVYVSRHGYLTNRDGDPRKLTDQATLISGLLAEVPELKALAGTSPQEWIKRARDKRVRDEIRSVFHSAGLVRQQSGLDDAGGVGPF